MHRDSIEAWKHEHVFLGEDQARNERRTWMVVGLTAAMMVVEIFAGIVFGSMALLADGIHMASHAGALSISVLAYVYARKYARDNRFSFGTGKLGELAGFSSAILLFVFASLIAYESITRLISPVPIRFSEAIAVAVLGLIVNLVSAALLHGGGTAVNQGHGHGHSHSHGHGHEDHNIRAAYLHVLADALTSILAIVGLLAGRIYGWIWMDPLVGIAGATVISIWALGLLRGTGAVLLDTLPDAKLSDQIRQTLEHNGDRVSDLHLWRVGPGHMAMIVSVITDDPREPSHYKSKLSDLTHLSHLTVEVQPCKGMQHAN